MRINHASLSRTLIYGTSAVKLADSSASEATHKWKVYVRGYRNTDISYFVRSVTFKIHETFLNPTRVVEKAPFELEEVGWGEFTIQGKIYFTDTHEKPAYFILFLKLHSDSNSRKIGDVEYEEGHVVNERMDTVIFDSPTETMYKTVKSRAEESFDGDIREKIGRERESIEKAIDFVIGRLEGGQRENK
jgi:YEATS domain-containing protein 4